jgi:RND superfamily putative drug exporter
LPKSHPCEIINSTSNGEAKSPLHRVDSLLLVARYREELRRHQDRHEAMALALRRAGPAIIASARTVTAGLLCLLLAETNSTKGLGPVCAIGIVVGLLAMVTLLPALLVTAGRWVFWPIRPRYGSAEPTTTGFWAKVGKRIARYPPRVWVLTVLALAVASFGLIDLHANGLTCVTNKESLRGHPGSVVGEQALARHFPAGSEDPVSALTDKEEARANAPVPNNAALVTRPSSTLP